MNVKEGAGFSFDVAKNTYFDFNTFVLAISPVIHIGPATHNYMKEANLSGDIYMDHELQTYTEQAVSNFTYRSGVFGRSFWNRWMSAVAFYRAGVDRRGAIQSRRSI